MISMGAPPQLPGDLPDLPAILMKFLADKFDVLHLDHPFGLRFSWVAFGNPPYQRHCRGGTLFAYRLPSKWVTFKLPFTTFGG